MQEYTRRLLDDREWWGPVMEEAHGTLMDTARDLRRDGAHLQDMTLLRGALIRDAGWSEHGVQALIATMGERFYYVPDIIADEVNALLPVGYRRS